MSLRRRLLLGIAAVAAVLVLTNLVLARTFESDLMARVDDDLATTAVQPAIDRPGRGGMPMRAADLFTDLYIADVDLAAGTVTRRGSAITEQDPPLVTVAELQEQARTVPEGIEAFTVHSAGGTPWRLVAIERPVVGDIVVVGQDLADVEDTLSRMRLVQVLGSAAVLAALAAVALWVLRLGVRPVVAMATTADAIAAGDLSRRVDHVDEHTEAGRLGLAFNAMLERIEAAFRAREASEARVRRFAADASHELRTPLTSIQGYAELWQAGGLREEGELAEAMRRMGEEGARMGALVEDLLLLARLDQHRPVERAPVRLDVLAADAVDDARVVEPGRPITLDVQPAVVDGDDLQLRQLVGNLVTNARVHTPEGTPVAVTVSAVDGTVRLEVADQGPGMPPEVAARVFERFYRADGARTRARGGTGLGLSIVAAIAEAHGGRATVTSTPGEGTRFIVELPANAHAASSWDSGR